MFIEQASLNFLIHSGALKAHFLPSTCNWLVSLKVPRLDLANGLLTEPYWPWAAIGLLHLTGVAKTKALRVHCSDGRTLTKGMRYSDWRPKTSLAL